MKLIVFGATGRTGQEIVRQALDRGHSVTALVRDETRLAKWTGQVQLVHGDMLDKDAVERAFSERPDAVVSALGIFHREPCTDLSDGTRNIIECMERRGIDRFAIVSSLGVGDSRGQGNFLARMIQKYSLSHALDDKERQEAMLRESGLNWTIVRPPRLTNREPRGGELVVWQGAPPRSPEPTWAVARATLARFLLDVLEGDQYQKEAVNISDSK